MRSQAELRAGDEALLRALRMRDEGVSYEKIRAVCGFSSVHSTRTQINRVDREYRLSCVNTDRRPE